MLYTNIRIGNNYSYRKMACQIMVYVSLFVSVLFLKLLAIFLLLQPLGSQPHIRFCFCLLAYFKAFDIASCVKVLN